MVRIVKNIDIPFTTMITWRNEYGYKSESGYELLSGSHKANGIVPAPTAAGVRQAIGAREAANGNSGRIHFSRRFCATKVTMERTIVRVEEVMDTSCSG